MTTLDFAALVRLNEECVKARLHAMGLGGAPDLALLRRASLADLVAARDHVQDRNRAPGDGGPRTISTVCDDRLIAAIYTMLHYEPEDDHGSIDPILELRDGERVTVLIHIVANPQGAE